jgi:segregation and condensation protein B
VYRLPVDATQAVRGDRLSRDPALARLEAALMVADEPLPLRKLTRAAELPDADATHALLARLQRLYDADGTAFRLEELAGGWQLLTRPEYHRWVAALRRGRSELRLGAAAKETLAIVAYRQPIMRAEIEAIRGVQCADVLRMLLERGLVRVAGRHASLGRPVLYGTTKKFLALFGLKSLDDLPPPTPQSAEPDPRG